MWKAERVLELDPAWCHAEVGGKLSLGHPGLGGVVIGLADGRCGPSFQGAKAFLLTD